MSIRIQNDGIGATGSSQVAPVDNAGRSGQSTFTSSIGNSGSDHVDISSLSGNIAATSSALADQQAARVSQLAALYSKGDFQVDSAQLSRALVSGAMSGSSFDGDN